MAQGLNTDELDMDEHGQIHQQREGLCPNLEQEYIFKNTIRHYLAAASNARTSEDKPYQPLLSSRVAMCGFKRPLTSKITKIMLFMKQTLLPSNLTK